MPIRLQGSRIPTQPTARLVWGLKVPRLKLAPLISRAALVVQIKRLVPRQAMSQTGGNRTESRREPTCGAGINRAFRIAAVDVAVGRKMGSSTIELERQ